MELVRSLMTVAALVAFVGILWWAYAPARRADWERKGLLDGDDE